MSPPFYSEMLFPYQRSYDVKHNPKTITAVRSSTWIPKHMDSCASLVRDCLQLYCSVAIGCWSGKLRTQNVTCILEAWHQALLWKVQHPCKMLADVAQQTLVHFAGPLGQCQGRINQLFFSCLLVPEWQGLAVTSLLLTSCSIFSCGTEAFQTRSCPKHLISYPYCGRYSGSRTPNKCVDLVPSCMICTFRLKL